MTSGIRHPDFPAGPCSFYTKLAPIISPSRLAAAASLKPMSADIPLFEVILYVENQEQSASFYRDLLRRDPLLDVPGMTEFSMGGHTKLGLMPSVGIARLLGHSLPHPSTGAGIPRCELYLGVPDAQAAYAEALAIGATSVSEPALRDWGDVVGYVADPDGHVIAFAHPAR